MLKYICQRLLAMAVTFFIAMTLIFVVVHSIPGSIFSSGESRMPKDIRLKLEQKYHLDKPVIVQYGYFLKNAAKLDFGTSIFINPGMPVFDALYTRMPVTVQLNVFSLIFFIPIGICFGVWAALKKNTPTDHFISVIVILFISTPSFVLAALMQYFFAFKLGWFPILITIEKNLTITKFHSMILPILALSFGSVASLTRWMRSELSEALNSDYMLLAKTKGLSQIQATLRHAIRNSFIPLVNIIIPSFLGILSGSFVIERIFGIPGVGDLTISALGANDQPLYIATLLFYNAVTLVTLLVMDISYGIVDPRIRMGGGKSGV